MRLLIMIGYKIISTIYYLVNNTFISAKKKILNVFLEPSLIIGLLKSCYNLSPDLR